MVKVLMLGNDHSVKGGITSVIDQLLAHDWASEGINLSFIPTYIEANSLKKIAFFIRAYLRIVKEIKLNRPNLVHIHMSYRGSFTRTRIIQGLLKKKSIPVVIHLHGSEFEKWYNEVNVRKKEQIRALMKESGAVIVLGEKWNKIVKNIEPSTNTVVINNTVCIPEKRVKWSNPFKILFLGVLIKRKGVSDLLKAVKLMKDEGNDKNFEVIIAGSGKEESALKDEAKILNIMDIVRFCGWTSGNKKKTLLSECQMLVLPSYNEGLPIAILEAMSYGMPIVATNVGDIPSAVKNGENGYTVEPGNIQELKEAIKLVMDEKKFRKFSSDSLCKVLHAFDERIFFDMMKKVYTSRYSEE